MNDVFVFFIIISAIAGGGASIEYYAAIRSVSRTDLEKFESQLPRLLQIIYFNRENAFVYNGVSKISGMDYLLNPKRSKYAALVFWIACVSFFVGIPILILAREYKQLGYFLDRSVMYTAASLVVYMRVAFSAGGSVSFNCATEPPIIPSPAAEGHCRSGEGTGR